MSIPPARGNPEGARQSTRFLLPGSAAAVDAAVARMRSEGWQILSLPVATPEGVWALNVARPDLASHRQ